MENKTRNNKESYHRYLTEKLDRGEPNIVVDAVLDLALNYYPLPYQNLRIADFGCYTGSLINRVYLGLSNIAREKTILLGFDKDTTIVKHASFTRPHISFRELDLVGDPPTVDPFHISILSNVLHEIYSQHLQDVNKAKATTIKAISNVKDITEPGGSLVILDGILPDDYERCIEIEFLQDESYSKFVRFANAGYIIDIHYKAVQGRKVQTTVGGLAAFMAKSRYLNTSFWSQEAQQVYHYFSQKDFEDALSINGLVIQKQIFQQVLDVDEKIKILTPSIRVPFKNTLIIAKRLV